MDQSPFIIKAADQNLQLKCLRKKMSTANVSSFLFWSGNQNKSPQTNVQKSAYHHPSSGFRPVRLNIRFLVFIFFNFVLYMCIFLTEISIFIVFSSLYS